MSVFNRDYSASDFKLSGKKSAISHKNKITTRQAAAAAAARQLIQENDVCEYLKLYAKDVTDVVNHAGYNIDVGLQFEEVKDKDNNTNRILAKLDPLTAEFIQGLRKKVNFANKNMLKNFHLKIAVSEVTA